VARRLLPVLLLALLAAPAHAGLIGATVNVSAYFPNTSSVYVDPGNVVVSDALEYPAGSYSIFTGSVAVDVSDTQIILDDTTNNALPASPADFNGYILRVISGPAIASASVDPASGWVPVEVTVVNGDLRINYQGLTSGVLPNPLSIIHFTTVPEPGLGLLAAVGLLGLALARRRSDAAGAR
jgi:MYXO-CTERM domain-containing protein